MNRLAPYTSFGLTSLLLAALLIGGCSSARSAADRRPTSSVSFPHHTVRQIQHQLSYSLDSLDAFRAKAGMALRTPYESGSFSAEVHHRRNDSLYVALSPGLGVEVARMLVTPDSFFVYDRLHKELSYGAVSLANRYLPVPISGEEVFRSFLGLLVPDAGVSWQLDAGDAYYYLSDPAERHRYTIDPSVWRVIRYEERNAAGDLVEERVFQEFDTISGLNLPRRIIFRRPQDQTYATLYYRTLTLNPGSLSFDLRVSSSAARIHVDESNLLSYD